MKECEKCTANDFLCEVYLPKIRSVCSLYSPACLFSCLKFFRKFYCAVYDCCLYCLPSFCVIRWVQLKLKRTAWRHVVLFAFYSSSAHATSLQPELTAVRKSGFQGLVRHCMQSHGCDLACRSSTNCVWRVFGATLRGISILFMVTTLCPASLIFPPD